MKFQIENGLGIISIRASEVLINFQEFDPETNKYVTRI